MIQTAWILGHWTDAVWCRYSFKFLLLALTKFWKSCWFLTRRSGCCSILMAVCSPSRVNSGRNNRKRIFFNQTSKEWMTLTYLRRLHLRRSLLPSSSPFRLLYLLLSHPFSPTPLQHVLHPPPSSSSFEPWFQFPFPPSSSFLSPEPPTSLLLCILFSFFVLWCLFDCFEDLSSLGIISSNLFSFMHP